MHLIKESFISKISNMHMYTQVLIKFSNAFNNMSKLLRIVGDFLSNAQKHVRSGQKFGQNRPRSTLNAIMQAVPSGLTRG